MSWYDYTAGGWGRVLTLSLLPSTSVMFSLEITFFTSTASISTNPKPREGPVCGRVTTSMETTLDTYPNKLFKSIEL